MATWTLTAQLVTSGTISVATDDHLWFNGTNFGDNVIVNSYQDSTHVATSTDSHRCTTTHVNNIKFVSTNSYSLNGGGGTSFGTSAPTIATCPWKFNFSDAASVVTSSATFYFSAAATPGTAMAGVTANAFEKISTTNTPAWTTTAGSGTALSLGGQTTATSHDFYIGTSLTPTSTGAKTGDMNIQLTYV